MHPGPTRTQHRGLGGLKLPNIPKSPVFRQVENDSQPKPEKKKQDKVELSDCTEDAVDQVLKNARKTPQVGVTSQVIVSEDGRFEASIDLRMKSDGSFDLDLAVKFAESSSTQLSSMQSVAIPEGKFHTGNTPSALSYTGLRANAERYTSYEQTLETRGFQANIFFEEAKAVALKAEQVHGAGTGAEYLSVSREIAHEFTLNVSISGDDINRFNEIGESLDLMIREHCRAF